MKQIRKVRKWAENVPVEILFQITVKKKSLTQSFFFGMVIIIMSLFSLHWQLLNSFLDKS